MVEGLGLMGQEGSRVWGRYVLADNEKWPHEAPVVGRNEELPLGNVPANAHLGSGLRVEDG